MKLRVDRRNFGYGWKLFAVGLLACASVVAFAGESTNFPASDSGTTNQSSALVETNAPAEPSAAPEKTPELEKPAVTNAPAATNLPPQKPKPESAFRIKRGFKINLVASDPLVASPVAMAFDEDSRLFVAEMRDYPSARNNNPHLGQITILEDSNGEGSFTSSTVFARDLPLPSAIVCYGGGVFVAAAPDILFLQDTNTDGVADIRRVIFTGFGGTNALDPEGLPHSLYWGIDNRIYGATGGNGATVVRPGTSGEPFQMANLDFSFDPRTGSLSPENGAALSGMTPDDWGRRFLSSPTRPLGLDVFDYRFTQRNPFIVSAMPVDVVEGPAVAVFQHKPPTPPARETPKTNELKVIELKQPTPLRTNEYSPAWMTKARGTVVYRGNLFPTNYRGNVFIAEPEAHVIHRAILREFGLQIRAERDVDERESEFLISTDPSFRPTQIVNGPDGALYVGDMAQGGDRGRIYRIAPVGFRPGRLPKLSGANPYEIVTALASTNAWHRDNASRLIYERRDPNTVRLLGSLLTGARQPVTRIHAMYGLAGMGALDEGQLALLTGDPAPGVRAHAARLAEAFVNNGVISDLLWIRLKALTGDRNVSARYHAALTAGSIYRPDKAALLMGLAGTDLANPYMQVAALNSGIDGAASLLRLASDDSRVRGPAGASFLVTLVDMIGVSGNRIEVAGALDFLEKAPMDFGPAFGLTAALGDGLRRTRSSLLLVDPTGRLQRYTGAALIQAADPGIDQNIRMDAIRLLGVGPYKMADGGAILLGLLGGSDNAAIQTAALQALENYTDPLLVPALAQRWNAIPRLLRSQAVTTLLARTDRIPAVIGMLDGRRLPPGDFLPWHINLLRSVSDQNIRDRAVAIFGTSNPDRGAELARLQPALKRVGNANQGRQIFAARCSACHTINAPNFTPGPDLAGIKVRGKEAILQAIIAPSAAIAPGHNTVVLETAGGETLVGTVEQQNRTAVLLRRPGRPLASFPRNNVAYLQAQPWSLMPDSVTQGFSEQNMADLLQFLLTVP